MGGPLRSEVIVSAARAGAAVASCEAIVILLSAHAERGLVAPAVAASIVAEIALAAIAGLLLAFLPRRQAALGVATAIGLLFVVGNGLVPAFPDRLSIAAGAAAVAILAIVSSLATQDGGAPAAPGIALAAAVGFTRLRHVEPGWAVVAALGVLAVVTWAGTARLTLPRWSRFAGFVTAAALIVTCLFLTDRAPAVSPRQDRRPDVLLVVLDTVRADAAPAREGAPYATPELARLALEGARFTSAFSTSCWTLPAHASLFTGLSSREHGTGWESPHLPASAETLAQTFARAGYRTAGFSANVWISPEFGFDRGFTRFMTVSASDRPLVPWPVRLFPGLFARRDATLPFDDKGGAALSRAALRFLAAEDRRPAFVFVNLLEAHMPYAPPERFVHDLRGTGFGHDELFRVPQVPLAGLTPETLPPPRAIEAMRLLYGAEVAYDDALLHRLLAPLRASGRLDDTILVVAGDHGENLGDHAPLDHQLGLWDSLVHVPLIVRFPRRVAAGSTPEGLVSLADIRGALLAWAALTPGTEPLPARDLVTFSYDRPGEILDKIRHDLRVDPAPWDRRLDGARSVAAKWIEASDGTRYAFDLAADPGERTNLGPQALTSPAFTALASRLSAWVAATPPGETPGDRALSEETRRRLRSLGYVH